MTKKNKGGAGKFFLGAALGAALGAVASKFIKVDLCEEDTADETADNDKCCGGKDGECCCKKDAQPEAKAPAKEKSESIATKKTKAK